MESSQVIPIHEEQRERFLFLFQLSFGGCGTDAAKLRRACSSDAKSAETKTAVAASKRKKKKDAVKAV